MLKHSKAHGYSVRLPKKWEERLLKLDHIQLRTLETEIRNTGVEKFEIKSDGLIVFSKDITDRAIAEMAEGSILLGAERYFENN